LFTVVFAAGYAPDAAAQSLGTDEKSWRPTG
jgi:hypothetical protein